MMKSSTSRPGRIVSSLLLSATVCFVSGTALGQCFFEGTLPPGDVPCYVVVQPIDVCAANGSSCAPFNTVNAVGNPSTAGMPFSSMNPLGISLPNNPKSSNPIGFVVDPATGLSPGQSGYPGTGVDITRTLLNELGVDLIWLPMAQYNSDINPNTKTTFQTLSVTQTNTTPPAFQSSDFQLLSYQNALATGAQPPDPSFPKKPLATPTTYINMFFLTTLNPPAQQAGGALYGFSWICNNGVSIAQNTFGFPKSRSSLPPRPDTIAHELGHNLCLDHTTYGAGPYNPQSVTNPFPPGGISPPVPANPLVLECDPSYPGCPGNLMTTGSLRAAPTVGCLLAPQGTSLSTCYTTFAGVKTQLPGLYIGTADQVNTPTTSALPPLELPVSQQAQVLTGGSNLLFPFGSDPPIKSGLLNPIPHETTKAQVETRGSFTASIIFDVSGPIGGRPGETLVAWILTLPQEQKFAGDSQFNVASQSRKDLVQDVSYFPHAGPDLLRRSIAYYPGADSNAENPRAAYSPCTNPIAQCLVVKFQTPGLGTNDSIKFSKSILSDGAPITNDQLCNAKITYVFSDGYATTSGLGPCPAVSLPLTASSWRPDPHVSAHIIKSNVFLAGGPPPPLPCQVDSITGQCPPLTLADADPSEEGGQPGNSCSNGAINGVIPGDFTVSAKQNCVFNNPCEIKGNLIIKGGSAYLNCAVDGTVTETSGVLVFGPSANIGGNVTISGGSSFTLGQPSSMNPTALVRGGLTIQNLSGVPQQGTVCGVQVRGNLVAQNNASPIEIGGLNCGNSVAGNLAVTKNSANIDVSDNSVTDNLQCQGNTGSLTGAANKVTGNAQGQCSTFVQ